MVETFSPSNDSIISCKIIEQCENKISLYYKEMSIQVHDDLIGVYNANVKCLKNYWTFKMLCLKDRK